MLGTDPGQALKIKGRIDAFLVEAIREEKGEE